MSRVILHVDGDAFFASCEVALNPSLRGRPVVTGKERGIASSLTYEAKARGVVRGMPIFKIKQVCPEAVILTSNYSTYALFSRRMYAIVRRSGALVDEYGIDECFADLSDLRRVLEGKVIEVVHKIKADLARELGLTFSVGVGPNKVIAKIGSKWQKPNGFTIIEPAEIKNYLAKLPIGKVWGIGVQTARFLESQDIKTALELAEQSESWVDKNLSKPFAEIWHELNGRPVLPLNLKNKDDYQSITKSLTFTPSSNDSKFVFAQLSSNIENACIKARRYKLNARKISFFLKTQDFRYHGHELKLPTPLSTPSEILNQTRPHFERLFKNRTLYRATGVTLAELVPAAKVQGDLFGDWEARMQKVDELFEVVDEIAHRFGKHSIHLGSSCGAGTGQVVKKHFNLPLMGEVT